MLYYGMSTDGVDKRFLPITEYFIQPLKNLQKLVEGTRVMETWITSLKYIRKRRVLIYSFERYTEVREPLSKPGINQL